MEGADEAKPTVQFAEPNEEKPKQEKEKEKTKLETCVTSCESKYGGKALVHTLQVAWHCSNQVGNGFLFFFFLFSLFFLFLFLLFSVFEMIVHTWSKCALDGCQSLSQRRESLKFFSISALVYPPFFFVRRTR
jgi:hypothetical protein